MPDYDAEIATYVQLSGDDREAAKNKVYSKVIKAFKEIRANSKPHRSWIQPALFKLWEECYLLHLSKHHDNYGQDTSDSLHGQIWHDAFVQYKQEILETTTKFLNDNTAANLEQASEDGQQIDLDLVNKLKWVLKKRIFYNHSSIKASTPLLSVGFMVDITAKFHRHELALSEVSQ